MASPPPSKSSSSNNNGLHKPPSPPSSLSSFTTSSSSHPRAITTSSSNGKAASPPAKGSSSSSGGGYGNGNAGNGHITINGHFSKAPPATVGHGSGSSAGGRFPRIPKKSTHARPTLKQILSIPPQALAMYEDFIAKNAGQVSQMESALRSLTYIIPGRFRDAEVASEAIHSFVQLLSLYHDFLLRRVLSRAPPSTTTTTASNSTSKANNSSSSSSSSNKAANTPPPLPSAHARYTRHWTQRSPLYRRVALLLQMVIYTELLCEMIAVRRSSSSSAGKDGGRRLKSRWKVVLALEGIKAVCRLILLRVTRSRPIVTPVLPERDAIPEDPAPAEDEEEEELLLLNQNSEGGNNNNNNNKAEFDRNNSDLLHPSSTTASSTAALRPHERDWSMPRTGMSLPSLPQARDISSYLLSRVLTADDIKPATTLLNQLHGNGQAAEVLYILAPLIYACLLAAHDVNKGSSSSSSSGGKRSRSPWTPWLVGLAVELVARQLRDDRRYGGARTTALEREEWNKRGWAMGWWLMRGAFYQQVTGRVVEGVKRRMPGFVAGIIDDYEYLWENYYFSTSS